MNVVLGNMILVRGGNEMRYIICQRCGQLLNPQEVFCPTCGLKTKRTQNVWRPLWMCILCIITMLFTKASNNFARVRAWLWEWEYKSAASTSFKINFDYPDGIIDSGHYVCSGTIFLFNAVCCAIWNLFCNW